MANEKKNDRRITRIEAFELLNEGSESGMPRGIKIEVRCRDERLCMKLRDAARSVTGKQALRSVLYKFIDEDTKDPSRLYLMQPQVSKALLDRFEVIRERTGPRSGRELVKKHLEEVFDMERGKRRMIVRGGKQKLRRFRDHDDLLNRARELARCTDLGRFTFNAKTRDAKTAILGYIKRHGLTQKAFFSEILQRICEAEESRYPSSNVAIDADHATLQAAAPTL